MAPSPDVKRSRSVRAEIVRSEVEREGEDMVGVSLVVHRIVALLLRDDTIEPWNMTMRVKWWPFHDRMGRMS